MLAINSHSHLSTTLRAALLGSVFTLALPVPVMAAEAKPAEEHKRQAEDGVSATALPSMTVTGSRAPEHYRLEETAPTVKLTREVYEQLPTGLRANDVVQRMPGVYTGGGPGENKDLRLRGLDKEYSRVQVDGVTLPDGGEKREFNLDRLPNFLVDEITIIRNPTADMEMDGIAGRLHVKTREIPLAPTLEMQGGVGDVDSFGTEARQAAVAYGQRVNDRFGFQASLSYSVEPNDKQKTALYATGRTEAIERELKPNEFIDVFLDTAWFYNGGEVHLKPMYQRQVEDKVKTKYKFTAAGAKNGTEDENEEKIKETIGAGLTNKHTFLGGNAIEGKLGYYTTTESKDDKLKVTRNAAGTVNGRESEDEEKVDQIWNGGLAYSHPLMTGDWAHKLKVGGDLRYRERDKKKSKINLLTGATTIGPKDVYSLKEFYRAGFVMDEIAPTDRVTLSPGIRYEAVGLEATDLDGPAKSSVFEDFLPSLPIAYRVTDKLALKAAASRVVNRPKFDELMPYEETSGATTLRIGNPDLQPERAWAFDVGADYVAEKFFLGANVFYRAIDDHLESRPTGEVRNGRTVEQVQNIGQGTLKGLELEQRLDLGIFGHDLLTPFRITANETFVDSKVTDRAGVTTPFAQQPDFIANLIVDWNYTPTGTKLSLASNYVGPIKRKKYAMDSYDEEVFWDFKITQAVTEKIDAFLLFENITDEDRRKEKSDGKTEIEKGGRSFFLGTTAKF